MTVSDRALSMDDVALAAISQYETYVELARLTDIPGVLAEPDHVDDGEIAPLGLTLITA